MNPIFIRNLCFSYNRHTQLLNGVNIDIPESAVYGLLGKNGAGKSTIIKLMLRQLTPKDGTILWWGESSPDNRIMYRIGSTVEIPSFYPYLSVKDHFRLLDIIFCKGQDRIDYLLDLTGLSEERDKKTSILSAGQKQRMAIALALFRNPDLLILDEPINGLDPSGIISIRSLIKQIKAMGKTVVLSCHSLSEMEKVCSHIGIIDKGKIVYQGPIDNIPEGENLESFYMKTLNLSNGICG